MYSNEIEALLKSLGIRLGDEVKVNSKKGDFEGVLMPRPEVGDSGILVIKKYDGYNIGIKYAKGMRMQKVAEAKKKETVIRAAANPAKNLPKISLLYTGGTIGSKIDYVSGGVYMLTKPEELLAEVPELNSIADIGIDNLMSIASEDMTYKEWAMIAESAAASLNRGAKGVVITHGTDTMHYTAAALSFMLDGINAPVVLTGAQRSSDRGSSDAFTNLICSAHIATSSDIAEVGVCMHSTSSDGQNIFIRGTKVRKMHTSRRDAFRPINSVPISRVDTKGRIEYLSDYRHTGKDGRKVKAVTGFEPKVAIVKTYPNSDPGIIEYYSSKRYKGIIIEGTGLGHVPTSPGISGLSWIEPVKRAVDSGMVIGITSQCLYGRVNQNVYRNLRLLRSAGAICCEDMMPEVAYVKLGFLLGNYGRAETRDMLNKNIAGEITQRTEFDTFEVD